MANQSRDQMKTIRFPLAWAPAAIVAAVIAAAGLVATTLQAPAQEDTAGMSIPVFVNPNRALEKPADVPGSITFLTTLDFPPFNFVGTDGKLTGFNVDLARAICEELQVRCQMRVVEFDRIVRRLIDGEGEAAIAGLAETERTRRRLNFTMPYLRMAGRFVVNSSKAIDLRPGKAGEAWVSVVEGSAHAAFVNHYFPDANMATYQSVTAARDAVKAGDVDLHFGDALGLSFWLQSDDAARCCEFHGGAFFEEAYFGRGMSIAVAKESLVLRDTLDYALQRLVAEGRFAELYLRYFPISIY